MTAGFYSKDEILWSAWAGGHRHLFFAGLAGALLTSLYTFRLIFTVFHGAEKTEAHAGRGIAHHLPLLALLVLSTGIGALIHPPLGAVLPASPGGEGGEARHTVELASAVVGIGGIALAALLFLGRRRLVDMIA